VFLNGTQISARAPQQLDATAVSKGMRVNLGHPGATTKRLHDLPDSLRSDPAYFDSRTSRAISHGRTAAP
jgi:hypothetical protein